MTWTTRQRALLVLHRRLTAEGRDRDAMQVMDAILAIELEKGTAMKEPTVKQTENGWAVVAGDEVLVDGLSNADAWRWLEREQNEHWSPVACRHDWSFGQWAKRWP